MRRLFVLGAGVVGLLLAGLVAAPPAAADFACDGLIKDQTVPGSIVVPSGAFCELRGVSVQGSVTVQPGAGLFTRNSTNGNTQILGSVFANKAFVLLFRDTAVLGSVDIARPRALGNDFVGAVCSSQLGADLRVRLAPLDANPDHAFFIGGSDCGGNTVSAGVSVTRNSVPVVISGNDIGANLACSQNNPPPIPGVPNTTTGIKSGQCKASLGF